MTINILQKQYEGFLNTASLWLQNEIEGVHQFSFQLNKTTVFNASFKENLRLGKLVERFVSYELQQDESIEILTEGTQIQDNKITIGELDCLLLRNNKPVHLEIIYKFYLYDNSIGNTEIEHWIGPNRRDSFKQKLDKLIDKQLPLLYHKKTKPLLNSFNLHSDDIQQQVYFKAQLFVPLKEYGKSFPLINNDCITGFYIPHKDISLFADCKFFIPTKHNWLITPHTNIKWLLFKDFETVILEFINNKSAPLCWLKKPNGELFKLFVVWW